MTPPMSQPARPTRQVRYQWRLREVMATHGLFSTTDLAPLLAERGIDLSAVQIWRLVTGTPERLSLPVLAALCDILDVTPAELLVISAEHVTPRKAAVAGGAGGTSGRSGGSARAVVDLAAVRPKRARIRPEG